MEDILNDFDKVMEEYNEAYTNAETQKDIDAVNAKYDKLINKAELQLEEEMEEKIKQQEESLLAEQEASEKELKDLEEADEKRHKESDKLGEEFKKEEEKLLQEEKGVNEAEEVIIKEVVQENKYTLSEVKKMTEKNLVVLANSIGITASTKDAKKDTLNKVIEKLGL